MTLRTANNRRKRAERRLARERMNARLVRWLGVALFPPEHPWLCLEIEP